MDNLKIIAIILITFVLAFATSFVLDFLSFKENPVKYILVVLLILTEIYFGYLVYQFVTTSEKKY